MGSSGFSKEVAVAGLGFDFVNCFFTALVVAARRGGMAQKSPNEASLTRMVMVDGVADEKEVQSDHWSMRTRFDHAKMHSSVADRNLHLHPQR
jgi:hypothetical protein